MRIVFMGTPQFAIPTLEALLVNDFEMVAVYTQPDKTAGRGRALVLSPVKELALKWHLPVEQPENLKGADVVARLTSYRPDVIVIAAYGQILTQSVLDTPTHGCVNIHGSLLPKYRGPAPVAAAILAGDDFTGATIMVVQKKLDSGPIITRAAISISGLDTTGSLLEKMSRVGAQMLVDVLPRWYKGEVILQPQDESQATYCSMISKEQGEIDWHIPAIDIWRRVRAFQPWPSGYTHWQGKQLKIIEAVPLTAGKSVEIGKVLALEKEGFGVTTDDGILKVLSVQLEGKRVMTAAEFLHGQREFIGTVLPS